MVKIPTASRYGLLCAFFVAASAFAQAPGLSDADRSAIQDLTTSYARALSGCRAEEFADLFAPEIGYFASGFRGRFVGRGKLIALVESERHCTAPAGTAARPGGSNGPTVELTVTPDGVRGVVRLGMAEYEDAYTKTPRGWRFASRTVILEAEKAAGLDAREMLAINELGGAKLGDYYEADQSGVPRLLTSGVRISVADGEVRGRAFLESGGYDDEVYEKLGPGKWRVKSSTFVPAEAR
jgi:SnoaL-like domain